MSKGQRANNEQQSDDLSDRHIPHKLRGMSARTRNLLLWMLALPGIVAPALPFYASGAPNDPHNFAFVDFFRMPDLGYEQTPFDRVANIIGALPIFIPFLLVPWQARSWFGATRHARRVQRASLAIALAWTLFWLLFQLSLWSHQVQLAVVSWEWQTAEAMAGELARAGVLFAVILVGLLVLGWMWLRPATDPPLDVTQCALLTVYLVAIVPELFADALISHEPDSQDRLLPGFAWLLWVCVIYAVTLALHLSPDTDEPRTVVDG